VLGREETRVGEKALEDEVLGEAERKAASQ
jgi:hypothetical protein